MEQLQMLKCYRVKFTWSAVNALCESQQASSPSCCRRLEVLAANRVLCFITLPRLVIEGFTYSVCVAVHLHSSIRATKHSRILGEFHSLCTVVRNHCLSIACFSESEHPALCDPS